MNRLYFFPIMMVILVAGACEDDGALESLQNNVVPKGNRTVAMDMNEAGNGEYAVYENAFNLVTAELYISEVKQSWDWDGIETEAGWNFDNQDVANLFFPIYDMPVSIIFRPINTVGRSMPNDLQDVAFEDPEMLNRFNLFIDSVKAHTPSLNVNAVYVGNEIDNYLEDNSAEWDKFAVFYQGAIAHVKEVWGQDIKTGTIGTMHGLIQEPLVTEFSKLHQHSDVIGVTYYPMNENLEVNGPTQIASDIDRLVELYGNKEIIFVECGYPTSASNMSSEAKQVEFVQSIFASWDKHAAKITHIDFTWLFDLSEAEALELNEFYQVDDNRFVEYLKTLGFRTNSGGPKAGYDQLKEELQKRDW